jgi:hypothetical protein
LENYGSNVSLAQYQSVKPSIPRPEKFSIKREYRLDSSGAKFRRSFSSKRILKGNSENFSQPVEYKNLKKFGFDIGDIKKEEKINEDMIQLGKALTTLCKCVKESLEYLKINEFGKAKFSLVSRNWEYAELDWEKYKRKLEVEHGIEFYKFGENGELLNNPKSAAQTVA